MAITALNGRIATITVAAATGRTLTKVSLQQEGTLFNTGQVAGTANPCYVKVSTTSGTVTTAHDDSEGYGEVCIPVGAHIHIGKEDIAIGLYSTSGTTLAWIPDSDLQSWGG